MVDHVSSMSMMTNQRKLEQINISSSPRERLKADYMSRDQPRLLQRSESVRLPNRYNPSAPPPPLLCRQNSSRNAHHHHNYQSNDSPKHFNEHVRVGYNQVTHNHMLHEEKWLPPRPPPRIHSYQPNSRTKYHLTPRHTFQPTNRGIHPMDYFPPSSASSRDQERPTLQRKDSRLQRKDSRLHQRQTLQRKESGHNGHLHHGHPVRPELQRKDATYRHANPPRHRNSGITNNDNPQGGDRIAQPKKFRRSNSLPISSLENLDSPSSRPQLNKENSMVKNKFSPRRSTSIQKQFDKEKEITDQDDDIWKEIIIENGISGAKSFFQSVYGKEKRKEPPTGASRVIYLEVDKEKEITDQDDDVWIERAITNGISGAKTYFQSVYGNVKRKDPPTGASHIIYLEDIMGVRSPKQRSLQQQQQQQEGKHQKTEVLPAMKLSSSGRNNDNNDVPSETKKDKHDNKKQKKPKRRASFFGFMTKKRSNKTNSNVK